MKTQTDISGPQWPQHLWPYTYHYGGEMEIELLCFVDWEPGDRSTGYAGAAWLIHAYAGGVDVIELLKDAIIRDIEAEAACSLSSD
jgi:hypothetical protein